MCASSYRFGFFFSLLLASGLHFCASSYRHGFALVLGAPPGDRLFFLIFFQRQQVSGSHKTTT